MSPCFCGKQSHTVYANEWWWPSFNEISLTKAGVCSNLCCPMPGPLVDALLHILNWVERTSPNDSESHSKERSDLTQQNKHMQNLLRVIFLGRKIPMVHVPYKLLGKDKISNRSLAIHSLESPLVYKRFRRSSSPYHPPPQWHKARGTVKRKVFSSHVKF